MSDTPRTDATATKCTPLARHELREGWTEAVSADFARELERELNDAYEALEYVRGLGEVYVYPSEWRCSKMGGPPDIDAYEKIDLSSVGL